MVRVHVLFLALLLVAGAVGLAWAAADAARVRQAIGAGASEATAGDGVVLRGTVGEPVIGVVSGAGARERVAVGQGYWHGGLRLCTVRLPVVVRAR